MMASTFAALTLGADFICVASGPSDFLGWCVVAAHPSGRVGRARTWEATVASGKIG